MAILIYDFKKLFYCYVMIPHNVCSGPLKRYPFATMCGISFRHIQCAPDGKGLREDMTAHMSEICQWPPIGCHDVSVASSRNCLPAYFGKSSTNLIKTSMQHTHKGSIQNEVKVFLCFRKCVSTVK
jgi:hypothetical protein